MKDFSRLSGTIFDLDQTLINSSCAEEYRKNRQWQTVYSMIPKFVPYQGISELLIALNERSIPICIATSSPSSYCDRVVKHFGWDVDCYVCYHDTKRHKPQPEPILLALEKLGVNKDFAISIGDHEKDILASKRAGVFSIGACWGCENQEPLLESKPDYICNNVEELVKLLNF